MSYVYLRLFIFLLAILIPACASSWHFTWWPLHTSELSRVKIYSLDIRLSQFGTTLLFHVWFCCLLIAYRFLRSQVRWSGIPISLRIFQFVVIHTIKGFGVVDDFLELSCFFDDPTDVANSISGSSAFSKSSLNMWKFMIHILLKPNLENFEHYFARVWDECNCAVVWAFFGIAFLWDWNENWPFPVLCPLFSLPNFWELTVAQIMNSLLPNSDFNWRK